MKLLELLNSNSKKNTFTKFSDTLSVEYEWISDELRAEMITEKGHLKVETYIKEEITYLVNQEFGQSRRILEREKRHTRPGGQEDTMYYFFILFIYCHLYSAFSIVQCSNALYRL